MAARESLLAEGPHPRVGLFYDTDSEKEHLGEHVDLTTPRGQAWYYESIRDFFSMIPPKHWAMIDQKPIVMTYLPLLPGHDQTHVTVQGGCAGFWRDAVLPDQGGVRALEAEDTHGVGRLVCVPLRASLGPGYDHSSVPDRDPLVIDRGGDLFAIGCACCA